MTSRHGGGARRGSGRERAPICAHMELTLEEASAQNRSDRLPTSVTCETCREAAPSGTKPRGLCMCGGQGKIRPRFFSWSGPVELSRRGQVYRHPLRTCGGWPDTGNVRSRLIFHRASRTEPASALGRGARLAFAGPREICIFLSIAAHPFFQPGAPICTAARRFPDTAGSRRIRGADHRWCKTRVKIPDGTHRDDASVCRPRNGRCAIEAAWGHVCAGGGGNAADLPNGTRALIEFQKLSSSETNPESAGFFGRVKEFLGPRGRLDGLDPGAVSLYSWTAV